MSKLLHININNLNDLKNQYHTLAYFSIDNGTSLAFEGKSLDTQEIILDEIILMLEPDDLRLFINNHYYSHSVYNGRVIKIIQSNQISNDDYNTIDYFTKDLVLRIELRNKYGGILEKNMESESIKLFVNDTYAGEKIVKLAYEYSNPNDKSIATIITSLFERNKALITQSHNDANNNTQTSTSEKQLVRTRNNPNNIEEIIQNVENDAFNNQGLGTSGFTSILAIIAVIIVVGVYIAVISIG